MFQSKTVITYMNKIRTNLKFRHFTVEDKFGVVLYGGVVFYALVRYYFNLAFMKPRIMLPLLNISSWEKS